MTHPSRRHVLGGLCACSALALAGCQTTGSPAGRVASGYRPDLASDEGALWYFMDREEQNYKQSRFVLRDAALNDYVRGVVSRLAAAHSGDMRTYIMRTPYFNASMAPNGMMQVWTGLLLRAQNEAQLAAVLGHEIGHYLERHSLQRIRAAREQGDLAAVLGLGLGMAGVGIMSNVSNMMILANLYAFNRDQERQADQIGIELMSAAGYAPIEASTVWAQLIEERSADPDPKSGGVLFATHPSSEERMKTLKTKAESFETPGQNLYADRYRQTINPLRRTLFDDELRLRQYPRSLKLFEIIARTQGEDAVLAFYSGEVYRLRNGDGDRPQAIAAYERAVALADCPPEVHRSLGLVRLQAGDRTAAERAFGEYLRLNPTATDRQMIQSYLVSPS
jgi:predicted Zn-dependent protease